MAIQTATQTATAQATRDETVPASPSTPEGSQQPERDTRLPEALVEGEEEAAELVRNAVENPRTTLLIVGATGIAAFMLFGGGFMRSRGMPALRRMMARTEEIRIPVALPVMITEIAREVIAGRREMSAMTDSHRSTR